MIVIFHLYNYSAENSVIVKEPTEKFTVIKNIYNNKRVHIQCESLYDDGDTKNECEPTSLH